MGTKGILPFSVVRKAWPYIFLPLAGVADLITTLIGTRLLSLAEQNANYIPFLAQTVAILFIFLLRRTRVFPSRIVRVCEVSLVVYSFSPAIWNLFLILLRLGH